jgi:hypothetical protein
MKFRQSIRQSAKLAVTATSVNRFQL